MTVDIAGLGRILSVWAHPDDETFLAGGVMAAARQLGQDVVCVSATDGEHGTDDPAAWPPERLGRLRRWEATAAMSILGVDDHRWLGFEDGTLDGIDPRAGCEAIAVVIDEVRPDTVLTFGPDGMTYHPDHIAVGQWVLAACDRFAAPPRVLTAALDADRHRRFRERLETWSIYMTDERPTPVERDALALQLDLDDEALDRKMAALHAMHSQVTPALAVMSALELRSLYGHESFVAADVVAPSSGARR
ncbi:PIG-L family deacetylase [Acidimicrobiia bacterium EGI L10123]|uniref:PIG-L deacetylase family protein n=1 Tax=Salinilacustrithrix flava TaxID=2957203 RepID=UPI003D7C258A|nr:PIG-L family deacetylase [Acidimicrobiia bacterium EGI L10123]